MYPLQTTYPLILISNRRQYIRSWRVLLGSNKDDIQISICQQWRSHSLSLVNLIFIRSLPWKCLSNEIPSQSDIRDILNRNSSDSSQQRKNVFLPTKESILKLKYFPPNEAVIGCDDGQATSWQFHVSLATPTGLNRNFTCAKFGFQC